MRHGLTALVLLGLLAAPVLAQQKGLGAAIEFVDRNALRVCADPHNMPFSNQKGEGIENKLADLVAAKTGRKKVEYTWFPQVTGFVRNTLGARRCDIIMGYPQGDELVQNTNPYYRTSYALVFRKGTGLDGLETLADPRLKQKKIGVIAGTPPATNIAINGLMGRVKPYHLMIDTRIKSSAEDMVNDIKSGVVDVGALWGPMAGYYAKLAGNDMVVVPLLHEAKGSRQVYRITMGVRPSDQEWKRELNRVIRENQHEINEILLGYGVLLLDEKDQPITN
ncbi:MAG: substrate-binding domain-containing protein [Parvibaculaceae bacterium]